MIGSCTGTHYYDLNIQHLPIYNSLRSEKTLRVEDVEANETYQDFRIVFRRSPFRIKYLTYRVWAKTPDELIEDALVYFFKKSGIFKHVSTEYSSADPDLLMRAKIICLEMCQIKKEWHARLALDLELVDAHSERIILVYSFDRKEKMEAKKTGFLPQKISKILHEELLKVGTKLQNMK
jgi:ABC-type uncharacterized transport system auxiliary subunit